MNKQLILLRHAATLDAHSGQKDFDRSLSALGMEELVQITSFLVQNKIKPDHILASAARRTTQTANLVAKALSIREDNIILKKELYNSTATTIEATINQSRIPENVQTLLLIAHNPGISELASAFVFQQPPVHLPTCGMIAVRLAIEHWTDSLFHTTELLFQKFPQI